MSEFWLRYVAHERRVAYEALGWQLVGTGQMGAHGYWSCLMKWPNNSDPIEPAPKSNGASGRRGDTEA